MSPNISAAGLFGTVKVHTLEVVAFLAPRLLEESVCLSVGTACLCLAPQCSL